MNYLLSAFRIAELAVDLAVIDVRLALNSLHRWIIT